MTSWPLSSCSARFSAQTYGVAGSLVVPTTRIGAAPILVIGTTNDPATPYVWAQSLAEQLDSGQLVTYEGEGHTAYAQGNACIDETVDDYLIDATVPAADPLC